MRLFESDEDFLHSFTESRRWQFAKTMPWNPHEYTVRTWVDTPDGNEEFDRFLTLVATQGYTGKWGKRTWPYLDVGGFAYYTFGAPLAVTHIINRKPTDKVDADRSAPSWDALGLWEPCGSYDDDEHRRKQEEAP